jgi:hypothetical protein
MRLHSSFTILVTAVVLDGFMTGVAFSQAGGAAGAGGAGAAAGNPALGGAAGGVGGLGGVGGVGGSSIGGGGIGGPGIGGMGGLGGTMGTHQGNILTGPGASGIPQNYFRGAAPGMNLGPQESPSGAPDSPLRGPGVGNRSRSGLGGGRNPAFGNGAVGRGVGPAPKGGDENPAKTLLDEMNGSNNGRRTGHAALRPPPRYQRGPRGLSSDPPSITPRRIEERAVYFAQRGAYEDSVYRPYRGTYRQTSRAVTANRNRRAY